MMRFHRISIWLQNFERKRKEKQINILMFQFYNAFFFFSFNQIFQRVPVFLILAYPVFNLNQA